MTERHVFDLNCMDGEGTETDVYFQVESDPDLKDSVLLRTPENVFYRVTRSELEAALSRIEQYEIEEASCRPAEKARSDD